MKLVAGGARRIGREIVAALLVPALALGAWPVAAAPVESTTAPMESAASAEAPDIPEQDVPSDVAAPTAVEVNRTVPAVDKVPAFAQLSARPRTEELVRARVFGEPLAPVGGEPTEDENAALGRALQAFQRRGSMDETEGLEALLNARGAGPWRASLQLNLGLTYLRTNRFTRAEAALKEAWDLAKADRDDAGRAIADKAVGELLWIQAVFAREPQLNALLEELTGREVRGAAAQRVRNARLEAWDWPTGTTTPSLRVPWRSRSSCASRRSAAGTTRASWPSTATVPGGAWRRCGISRARSASR